MFLSWGATCVGDSQEDDLAILHLHTPFPVKAILNGVEEDARLQPLELAERQVRDGESIAASGYPLAHVSMVTTTGIIASAWSSDPAGGKPHGSRHLADLTANRGSSGGPCYSTSDGILVGALIAGRTVPVESGAGHYFAGLSVIVPTTLIRALIAESGI
jgi:S1-C subfamily serine protease